jgi:hAT family C-terminal dimerisation region
MNISINLLKAEMLIMKNCLNSNFNHDEIKRVCEKNTFPNLYKLLQVALTIPVSSATRERSFSSMRRLKNWLRASMEQQRFTDLSILNIERNVVNKITSSEILNKYSTTNRKILLI